MSDLYHAFANAISVASNACTRFRTLDPSPPHPRLSESHTASHTQGPSPPSASCAFPTTASTPPRASSTPLCTPTTPPSKATICASPSHFCASPPKPNSMPRTQASPDGHDAHAASNAEPRVHDMHEPRICPTNCHPEPGGVKAMADVHAHHRHRFRPLSRTDSITSPPTPSSYTSSSQFTFDMLESQEDLCASQPEPPDSPTSSQQRPPSVSDHIATMKLDTDISTSDSSAGPSPSPQRTFAPEHALQTQTTLPSFSHANRHCSSPLSKTSRRPRCSTCSTSPVPKLQKPGAPASHSKQRVHMKLRQRNNRRSRSRSGSGSGVTLHSPRASPRPFTGERDWSIANVRNPRVAQTPRPSSVPATPLAHIGSATGGLTTSTAPDKSHSHSHYDNHAGEAHGPLRSAAGSAVARRLFSGRRGSDPARPSSAASCLDAQLLSMAIPEEAEDGRAAPSPNRTLHGCPDSPASITSRVSSPPQPPMPLRRTLSSPMTGLSSFTERFAGAFQQRQQRQQAAPRRRTRGFSLPAPGESLVVSPTSPAALPMDEEYVTTARMDSNDVFGPTGAPTTATTPTTTASVTPTVTGAVADMEVRPSAMTYLCYPEGSCHSLPALSCAIGQHLGMPSVPPLSAGQAHHRRCSDAGDAHDAPADADGTVWWQQQQQGEQQREEGCATGGYVQASMPGTRAHGHGRRTRRQRHSMSCPDDVPAPPSNDPLVLPCFHFNKPGFAISPLTLSRVLEGQYRERYDQLHIVDCRFDYEYEGGHIEGAINLWRRDDLLRFFMRPDVVRGGHANRRTLIVLHCEFSSERAPAQFDCLRGVDRSLNHDNYPHLLFPEVYILNGGYSSFNGLYPHHCTNNGGYTRMTERAFSQRWRESESELHSQRRENYVDMAEMAAMLRCASLGGAPFPTASSALGSRTRHLASGDGQPEAPWLP